MDRWLALGDTHASCSASGRRWDRVPFGDSDPHPLPVPLATVSLGQGCRVAILCRMLSQPIGNPSCWMC